MMIYEIKDLKEIGRQQGAFERSSDRKRPGDDSINSLRVILSDLIRFHKADPLVDQIVY